MAKLGKLARLIRSKNAGPFELTFDIMFEDPESFERVRASGALSRELPGRTRFRTYPSAWPLLRLDGIYCRPHSALVRSFTDREARHISDHLPVIADVRVVPP